MLLLLFADTKSCTETTFSPRADSAPLSSSLKPAYPRVGKLVFTFGGKPDWYFRSKVESRPSPSQLLFLYLG